MLLIETPGTILFGKNEFNKVKMASTTKIMTATVVIENCNLSDTVTVSQKAAGTGGSRIGLKTDDKVSVNDLLYGLLLHSGNDAAVALAEFAGGSIDGFADMMNKKASELGLNNTCFKTPHGLDKEGHYTTAYELAVLSNYALHNETFAKIVNTKSATISINGSPRTFNNTNELLGNLDGVYGIKTGFTNGANRCLVSACKRGDLDIICVVLGADTKNFRTSDSIKLIEYSFSNFTKVNISEIVRSKFNEWKKDHENSFYIYKPSPKTSNISFQNSKVDSISPYINCETNLIPPMNKNTVLGDVSVSIDNKTIFSQNILLDNDIYCKNVFEYFIEILKRVP